MKRNLLIILPAVIVLVLFIQSCSTINNLEDHDIYGSRVAMDMRMPPDPVVNVDYGSVNPEDDQIFAIVQLGTNLVKANEAEKAESRMISALEGLYIPEYAAELTFDRLVKTIDGTMLRQPSGADIILEVDVKEYGLEAYSFTGNVAMFFVMTSRLYHPGEREVIWQRKVSVEKELTPEIFGFDPLLGNIVSIAGLAELDEAELADGFKKLTYDVMQETVGKLQDDLRKARRR